MTVIFSRGKRHAKRWYAGVDTNVREGLDRNTWAGFDASMPAEWESWLRHRRDRPPTEVSHLLYKCVAAKLGSKAGNRI
jgi:hypothetical protein